MPDTMTTLQELKDRADDFRKQRGWGKGHTAKNLAVSIALEASELLEHFQWDEGKNGEREKIEEELADVIIYCLQFAIAESLDVSDAVIKKLEKNARKYPVDARQTSQRKPA